MFTHMFTCFTCLHKVWRHVYILYETCLHNILDIFAPCWKKCLLNVGRHGYTMFKDAFYTMFKNIFQSYFWALFVSCLKACYVMYKDMYTHNFKHIYTMFEDVLIHCWQPCLHKIDDICEAIFRCVSTSRSHKITDWQTLSFVGLCMTLYNCVCLCMSMYDYVLLC